MSLHAMVRRRNCVLWLQQAELRSERTRTVAMYLWLQQAELRSERTRTQQRLQQAELRPTPYAPPRGRGSLEPKSS